MKLSIIIPVYNAEKYIDICMMSIMKELDNDIEIVLLDDGSTDNSLPIIKKFKQKNVRIFHHTNHGVSYTRNRGIKVASGEYIMFVDSDDYLIEGWRGRILNSMKDQPDIIYFSDKINKPLIKKKEVIDAIFGVNLKNNIGNMSSPWSKLYKKDLLLKNNICFDTNLINGEDALFNLNAILSANSIEKINCGIYKYRIYNTSSSRTYSTKFLNSNFYFLSKVEKLLDESKCDNRNKNRYISKSVVYSVYLYLCLIYTLSNKEERKKAFEEFKSNAIWMYIKKYSFSKDCSLLINFIYFCVKYKITILAKALMIVRKYINKNKKEESRWEDI